VQEVRCKRLGVRGKVLPMSISVSNSLPPASVADVNLDTNSTPAPRTQSTTNHAADTVTLSQPRQVTQLYQQGQQVPQIASTLSLPVDIVNNYLGITKAQ
jgi:DNA-binding NarL/FixJ family response regulator